MTGKRRREIIGGIFAMSFALILAISTFYQPVFTRKPEAYCRIHVTLAGAPQIIKASRQPADLVFDFKEYPRLHFGAHHSYFLSDYPEKLQIGDTATIIILKEEYRRTIRKEGNFFERLVSKRPNLYGFITNGENYISIDKIADDSLDPDVTYVIVGVIVLVFFSTGFKALFFHR